MTDIKGREKYLGKYAEKGSIPWNKGLTKETDSRVSRMGFKEGNIPWNKGKRGLQKGWNRGLTSKTDLRIKTRTEEEIENIRLGLLIYYQNNPNWKEERSKSLLGKYTGEASHYYIDGRSYLPENGYRGEDWEVARKRALEDANNKCFFSELENCKGCPEVHHIIPYFESHDNSQDNLIVLCTKHHRMFEARWRNGGK
jgi:hypothetical protein